MGKLARARSLALVGTTYSHRAAHRRRLAVMTKYPTVRSALLVGIAISSAAVGAQDVHSQHHAATKVSAMQTPPSLAAEHRELHEVLARASSEGGELGGAAEALEKVLAPHFKREEEIATPPLGLLPKLARENATADMR